MTRVAQIRHDDTAGARRLTEERMRRGLSMNQLSKESDVSDGVIARSESGQPISARSRKRLAEALDLSVTDIWPLVEDES